ncbi:MAG TPA: toprim domain-containing protein [Stellaceae bacterium]|nr:toprim domain-containing protein [Stellaceae bacterium]
MTAQKITEALGGKWFGAYGVVCCPVHNDRHPSLRIREGDSGVLVRCYAGCDPLDILAELRRRGLLDDLRRQTDRPRDLPRERAAEQRDRAKRSAAATDIWQSARPIAGTAAETYLRRRGIEIELPPSLRFNAALMHGPTGLFLPAMVAAVQAPSREIVGVHRIYIKEDGTDKAPLGDAKLSLGPISGGAVRLAKAGDELAIAEGIETALAYTQATGRPTWAALSTSGMRSIILPPLPAAATVYLAADVDPNGAGEAAAEDAARRFFAEGRKVKIATPISGSDFNDAINMECAL